MEGDTLLPGLIDLHTDHFEKHVLPRPGVRWDLLAAVMAHDAQMAAGGVTTSFDCVCVGVSIKHPERREIRSEEHTSELQSLMRISYAVFCLKKKNKKTE